MTRQIAYDPIALRTDLLSVFWANGFAQTSLSDLEAATGLNRRQLYNGLGDKRDMFLQALDDFYDKAGRQFLMPLEQDTAGVEDIAKLLNTFVRLAGSSDGPSGCLVCSTSQEEIAQDDAVRRRIDAYFERIKVAYRNALTRAVERHEIDLTTDEIEGRSTGLFAVHVAMCILGRAKRPKKELRRMAKEAIVGLS